VFDIDWFIKTISQMRSALWQTRQSFGAGTYVPDILVKCTVVSTLTQV
jgi:hypothetical protein